MQEDNLYPRDGEAFPIPKVDEQEAERKQEKIEVVSNVKVLQEIIERFDERIAHFESVRAIPDDVKLDKDKFMSVVLANDIVLKNLEVERNYLQGLIDEHAK